MNIRQFLAIPFAIIGLPLALLAAYIAGGKDHFYAVAGAIAGTRMTGDAVEL